MGQTYATKRYTSRDEPADPGSPESAAGSDIGGSTRLGSYLRNLREGYGYTLRKVEERAQAAGEAIDNSQLSRFEKGKAIPSFEKLRALARVFNVPVQNFSDVLDLEEYRHFKPDSTDFDALIRTGAELLAQGEHGQAFVTYERAVEIAAQDPDPVRSAERMADARLRVATALKVLGKLYMTERELREILKQQKSLRAAVRLRTLLQLSYLFRELGDLYLGSILAKEALTLAESSQDQMTQAGVLNTLGNVANDESDFTGAEAYYSQALQILEKATGHHEMQATVLTNLGGCKIGLRQYDEGFAMLREAHTLARRGGYRRVAALSLTRLAEAFRDRSEYDQAREALHDSDALASRADDPFTDILFLNAYHRWTMARDEEHGTREKIAFGRLRHLRSMLQRRFPEVDAFDQHVERTRR